jgi:hypothetical protein
MNVLLQTGLINPVCDDDKMLKCCFNGEAPWQWLRQKPRPESQIFRQYHIKILPLGQLAIKGSRSGNYFCDPQSPWQRGSNENTNLLLRQYFPRGTDLSGYSQEQLDQVALRLNQRPRKTLGFQTPAGKLQASVASTV